MSRPHIGHVNLLGLVTVGGLFEEAPLLEPANWPKEGCVCGVGDGGADDEAMLVLRGVLSAPSELGFLE